MRLLALAFIVSLVAASASAGVIKWEHPDGRIGFASSRADVPPGARIVSGAASPAPAPPPAARDKGVGEEVGLCAFKKATLADVLQMTLKELDWEGEFKELRDGKGCAVRRANHMVTQFKGACALNVAKGLETEDAALERVISATLFECNDFPISMRDKFVPPDPGLR
jgi:hypothetical protein